MCKPQPEAGVGRSTAIPFLSLRRALRSLSMNTGYATTIAAKQSAANWKIIMQCSDI
jgi:hypothetical protein